MPKLINRPIKWICSLPLGKKKKRKNFYSCKCKMLFHPFLLGLRGVNNRAQCPSGVRCTPCSGRGADDPWMRHLSGTSAQSAAMAEVPEGKELAFFPFNIFHFKWQGEFLERRRSSGFYEPVLSVGRVEVTPPVKSTVCHYHQGGDLTAHTL